METTRNKIEYVTVLPNDEWTLGFNALTQLTRRLPAGATVVELGSGESSRCLVELGFKVYAVEQDEEFIGKHEGVNYIYAPIDPETQWYDLDSVKAGLPDTFSALIIDGPNGDRSYFASCWRDILSVKSDESLMNRPIIVIDDFHRSDGSGVILKLLSDGSWFHSRYAISICPTGHILQPVDEKSAYEGSCVFLDPNDDRETGNHVMPTSADLEIYSRWALSKEYRMTRCANTGLVQVAPSKELRPDVMMREKD